MLVEMISQYENFAVPTDIKSLNYQAFLFRYPHGSDRLLSFPSDELANKAIKEYVKKDLHKLVNLKGTLFGYGYEAFVFQELLSVQSKFQLQSHREEPSLVTLLKARNYHKEYAANTTDCRRDHLFRNMDNYKHVDLGFKCLCCDICSKSCLCGQCDVRLKLFDNSFF